MAVKSHQLILVNLLDALEVEMHNRLINFPRSERYLLVKEYTDTFYRIRHEIINALIGSKKRISLNAIDAEVEYLRQLLIKTAKMKLMTVSAASYVTTEFVNPIGKIVGSWRTKFKSAKNNKIDPNIPNQVSDGDSIYEIDSAPF